jgi:hypothetical protein
MLTATQIRKEDISNIHFAHKEVLSLDFDRKQRQWSLNKALALGNAYHGKVHIIFEAESGENLEVDTTIWAVTDSHISLKGGVSIPISAIKDVYFS